MARTKIKLTPKLEALRYRQRRVRRWQGEDEVEDVFLVGRTAQCQCFREAATHLLRKINEPESLMPVCGATRDRWCHDNNEGELDDVTCQRCIGWIQRALDEKEKES